MSRIRNTKRNIIFGLINKCVFLVFPFLIRTMIIRQLGIEYLGLNSLFTSILYVLSISELGFSSAIVFSLYKPIANQEGDLICAYLSFLRKVYRVIGIVITIVGLCLLPFLPYLIKGEVPDSINIYILYLIYLVNTSIGYFFFGYKNALLNAHQRVDIVTNISTTTQCLLYICQMIVLITLNNYYIYLVIMPLCTILNNIITGVVTKRKYPQYFCKGHLKTDTIKELKSQVAGLMIHRLCLASRNSLDSIFISAFIGLKSAAIYSNYYYVMNTLVGILAIVGNSMLASVGDSIATETQDKNYKDLKRINFLYMQIAGIFTVLLLSLYQQFMELWVGKENMLDFITAVLFCAYFYVLKMGDVRGTYSDAAGLWWQNRYRAIFESLCNLVLNASFVFLLGIKGIIIATLISLFVINFIIGSQIIFKYYFTNYSCREYYVLHMKYAITTIFISCICVAITRFITVFGFVGFVTKLIVCVILSIGLYVILYYRDEQFKDAVRWIRSVDNMLRN